MLITPSDFGGDYRLFNANNLDIDTIRAIDDAQAELARDLFPVGSDFIIQNNPTDPPNLGLRQLGLHNVFIPWVFLRLEGGIAGAGIKKTSDVPGRSRFASGAFFAIARNYNYFLREWVKYEGYIQGNATTTTTILVDTIMASLLAAGMVIEINGSQYSIVSSSSTSVDISPALTSALGSIVFRQLSLRVERDWVYL